jgi:hypothetical protein
MEVSAADAHTVLGFSVVARRLADEARRRGLIVPGFRSPPRLAGVVRTVRRARGNGAPVIAVARRGRPPLDVAGDMIDGVVVANGLAGDDARRLRRELAETVGAVPSAGARVA